MPHIKLSEEELKARRAAYNKQYHLKHRLRLNARRSENEKKRRARKLEEIREKDRERNRLRCQNPEFKEKCRVARKLRKLRKALGLDSKQKLIICYDVVEYSKMIATYKSAKNVTVLFNPPQLQKRINQHK